MLKEKITYLPLGILTIITATSGAFLAADGTLADSETANASVTVTSACTMTATVNTAHALTMSNGNYQDNIGTTTLQTVCNDNDGYAIYAVGYTDDTLGNTNLSGASGSIATSTATSGNVSAWAMKVSSVAGSFAPTIQNGFNNYTAVPASYTVVASLPGATDTVTGSSVQTTYAVYMSQTQAAGTYVGQVKYSLVHPSSAAAPTE